MVWFVPVIIGAIATGGIEGLFYFLNKGVAEDINRSIEGLMNGIQYGISFWDFLFVCWWQLLIGVFILYIGWRIANPIDLRCDCGGM